MSAVSTFVLRMYLMEYSEPIRMRFSANVSLVIFPDAIFESKKNGVSRCWTLRGGERLMFSHGANFRSTALAFCRFLTVLSPSSTSATELVKAVATFKLLSNARRLSVLSVPMSSAFGVVTPPNPALLPFRSFANSSGGLFLNSI